MKWILFASFRYRLAVFFAVSLLLTFGFLALLVTTSWGEWRSAADYHARWSVIGDRCQALFGEAEAEFKSIQQSIWSSCDSSRIFPDCLFADIEKFEKADLVFAPVVEAGCIVTDKSPWDVLAAKPSLVIPVDPGNSAAFALKANGMELKEFLVGFVAALLLLMLVADVLRRFIVEPQVGWRRLNTMLSVLSGFVVAAYAVNEGAQPEVAAGVGLVSIAAAFAAIIYLRAVVLWVAAGFQSIPPAAPHLEAETVIASVETQATPFTDAPVLNLCPIEHGAKSYAGSVPATLTNDIDHDKTESVQFKNDEWYKSPYFAIGIPIITFGVIFRPNLAYETFISTLVQIIGLAVIVGVFYGIKWAIDKTKESKGPDSN